MEYLKFRKYEIGNGLEPLLIFYDTFLSRPILPIFMRKILYLLDRFIRAMLVLFTVVKMNKIVFRQKSEETFIIRRFGKGKNRTKIILRKVSSNQFKIYKYYQNKRLLKHDLDFYNKYNKKVRKIALPEFRVKKGNIAEINFIRAPNLATQIRLGFFNGNQLFDIFRRLSKYLDKLYANGSNKTLIHGDLSPDNIYYVDGYFYLIDYGDSHMYYKNYDKYILLKRLLVDYCGKADKRIIRKYFPLNEINKFENHLTKLEAKKHF